MDLSSSYCSVTSKETPCAPILPLKPGPAVINLSYTCVKSRSTSFIAGIVLPGIASISPFDQSLTNPRGCEISCAVSCARGDVTKSLYLPGRCSSAISVNPLARSRNMFQSDLDSHNGSTAGLNGWMNGCISVLEISCFSYHVAAGNTMSE